MRHPIARAHRLFLALLLLLPLASQAGDKIGMLTQIQGQVVHQEGEAMASARMMALLESGDRLLLGDGAEATYLLFSGERQRFKGPGELHFAPEGVEAISGESPEDLAPLPKEALKVLQDRVSQEDPERGAGVVFRSGPGTDEELVLLGPVETRIASQHPHFRWKALPENDKYRLTVSTLEGETVWDEVIKGTERLYPDEAPKLRPGGFYFWDLRALAEESSALVAGSDFSLLSEQENQSMNDQRVRLLALAQASMEDPGPEFVLAMLYRDLELFEDAHFVLEDLEKRFPEQKMIEQALIDLFQHWGRQREELSESP